MKLIAAAVLAGALIIATAIVATRSTAEPPAPVADVPTIESACGMAGGFWSDGPTDDPFDGTCVMP